MSQYCQAACSFCSGSAFGSTWNTQACSNGNPSCFSWTSSGQCSINRAYMWENCRQSCGWSMQHRFTFHTFVIVWILQTLEITTTAYLRIPD
ncbi:hypothetical protein ANCCAN_20656 [Ancylostoma caninum]|uniref:ShKT domain-containing protein n=1 Tax=Ancylostoma caninum TaxID=29170 RepID=A0A368FR74_ANCCA|nr:hypothetical protein ANCCAN_20656 [Ancylostoma caninum]